MSRFLVAIVKKSIEDDSLLGVGLVEDSLGVGVGGVDEVDVGGREGGERRGEGFEGVEKGGKLCRGESGGSLEGEPEGSGWGGG